MYKLIAKLARVKLLLLAILLALLVSLDVRDPEPVRAAVFDVPAGSVNLLIDAINIANANEEPDVINLASSAFYSLKGVDNETDGPNGLPSITSEITINADGAFIERSDAENIPDFRIFHIGNGGKLTLNDAVIRGGFFTRDLDTGFQFNGGGIFNSDGGELSINGSGITDNEAGRGGGIFNSGGGKIDVKSSTISLNRARGEGGGVYNAGEFTGGGSGGVGVSSNEASLEGGGILNIGTLVVNGGVIFGNSANANGGGIYGSAGSMTITDSVINRNEGIQGGGLYVVASTAELTNVNIINNDASSAGGGITAFVNGDVTITNSRISGNEGFIGGGIYVDFLATVTVINSNVSNNSAIGNPDHSGGTGGGILNANNLTLINSTLSGNSAASFGGGLYNHRVFESNLTNVTITDNEAFNGGGIFNEGPDGQIAGGIVNLLNSIVANNLAGADCEGVITSNGHNLDSDGSCGLDSESDLPTTDPLIGPLQRNGGFTETHALLIGSPAIDAGDDSVIDDPLFLITDQRGFPRFKREHVDIGAYESAFIVVNNTSEGDDNVCDDSHCTLREAINAANDEPGDEFIVFDIPETDDGFDSETGVFSIRPLSALPTITGIIVIDGYTQSGAAPNTNSLDERINAVLKIELDGSGAGADVNGLHITGGDSEVKGLIINRFGNSEGSTGGAGIKLEGSGNNTVAGNFIGTDVSGTASLGNFGQGVYILNSPGNVIGGSTPESRNLISANGSPAGIAVEGVDSVDNIVQGNFIGTDIRGIANLGNAQHGVIVQGEASGNTSGGIEDGEGNVIAFNNGAGVFVESGTGNAVSGNAMFSNVGLAIDLAPAGRTPNDVGDADASPNNLQNFPEILEAEINNDGNLIVEYVVDSLPSSSDYSLSVEFFISDEDGEEGQRFIGSHSYVAGKAQMPVSVNLGDRAALAVSTGDLIVATVTDSDGNTSEFSDNATITTPLFGDLNCDGFVDIFDAVFLLQRIVNALSGLPICGL